MMVMMMICYQSVNAATFAFLALTWTCADELPVLVPLATVRGVMGRAAPLDPQWQIRAQTFRFDDDDNYGNEDLEPPRGR